MDVFLCRDEFGRSHCVDQQLQLRQREQVTAHGISFLTAALLLDIHVHIAELLYIGRYRLAVARNAVALQKGDDVPPTVPSPPIKVRVFPSTVNSYSESRTDSLA